MLDIKGLRRGAALFVLTLAATTAAFSQTATLSGRVTDSTDAVIPATRITVVNEATAVERQVETNEAGLYTVPSLAPGRYQILVEQDGFKVINRTGIVLEVDQRAEVNFTLQVGEVTEQIEVTADAVQLNTVDASRGQVIENKM